MLQNSIGYYVNYYILHELRRIDFTPVIRSSVKLENVTIRDEIRIYYLAAGLAEILFPNKEFLCDDLEMIMDIVVEYRTFKYF